MALGFCSLRENSDSEPIRCGVTWPRSTSIGYTVLEPTFMHRPQYSNRQQREEAWRTVLELTCQQWYRPTIQTPIQTLTESLAATASLRSFAIDVTSGVILNLPTTAGSICPSITHPSIEDLNFFKTPTYLDVYG